MKTKVELEMANERNFSIEKGTFLKKNDMGHIGIVTIKNDHKYNITILNGIHQGIEYYTNPTTIEQLALDLSKNGWEIISNVKILI